jgi:hypothetical protein
MPDDTDFDFDETWYLSKHPDVKRAVDGGMFVSGFAHYRDYGRAEGRIPAPPGPVFSPGHFCSLTYDQQSTISWALMDLRAGRFIAPGIVENLCQLGIVRIAEGQPRLTAAGRKLTVNDITVGRLNTAACSMLNVDATKEYADGS